MKARKHSCKKQIKEIYFLMTIVIDLKKMKS